jgi:nicotinamide-nucleotide amidase
MSKHKFEKLAIEVGEMLMSLGFHLAIAESCTGGWVSEVVTSVSGSSNWFDRGFITYSNIAKYEMLDVPAKTIKDHGAVSEETALAMASGALKNSHAEVALAVTGTAGPLGGSIEKPVGLVCFAWVTLEQHKILRKQFSGDRTQIREQAVECSLLNLLSFLEKVLQKQ